MLQKLVCLSILTREYVCNVACILCASEQLDNVDQLNRLEEVNFANIFEIENYKILSLLFN